MDRDRELCTKATRRPTSLLLSCGCLSRYVRVPSEPPRGFRIVVALTSAGDPSNPRVRADPVIDPPQADVERDVLFAPYAPRVMVEITELVLRLAKENPRFLMRSRKR